MDFLLKTSEQETLTSPPVSILLVFILLLIQDNFCLSQYEYNAEYCAEEKTKDKVDKNTYFLNVDVSLHVQATLTTNFCPLARTLSHECLY